MPKPAKRWIPKTAKEHVTDAKVWRKVATVHADKSTQLAMDVINTIRPTGARQTKTMHSERMLTAGKLLGNAATERNRAFNARETARKHIGAAKRIVEEKNPSAAKRGRMHRLEF